MPNGLFPSLGVTGNKPVEKLEPNTIMEWQECQGAKVANKCKNWISEGDLPTRLLFHYYNVYNTTVYPVNGIRAFFTLQQCGLIAFWAFFFLFVISAKKCSKIFFRLTFIKYFLGVEQKFVKTHLLKKWRKRRRKKPRRPRQRRKHYPSSSEYESAEESEGQEGSLTSSGYSDDENNSKSKCKSTFI